MKVNAISKMSLPLLSKCNVAICLLTYVSRSNSVDNYVGIDESTALKCFERFVKGVNEAFETEYLKRPNNNDIECYYKWRRPGILGSIHYMHQ